jgi:hypothetical protein
MCRPDARFDGGHGWNGSVHSALQVGITLVT